MSRLESALQELEIATVALAEIGIENLEQAQPALDRRSKAIVAATELVRSLQLNAVERDDTLGKLRRVCDAGAEAQQRIAARRGAAVEELNKWTGIYRALRGAGTSVRRIDVSG